MTHLIKIWGSNETPFQQELLKEEQAEHKRGHQTLTSTTLIHEGREPWSSGYGRRLVFQRLWVRIPAP